MAFAGFPVDLSERTPLDTYALALDTLAEAGVPIHITETNFIAPDDPELRAAHAEGLLRIWWGHPSVEQIVFWGPWNKVAGRNEFDVGFWDDNRNLTRHGEAVLSLLNDRWRTDVVAVADASGTVELTAHARRARCRVDHRGRADARGLYRGARAGDRNDCGGRFLNPSPHAFRPAQLCIVSL